MSKSYYDDGAYVVTSTTVSTPSRIYPIGNAIARVRRDPLWLSAAAAVLLVTAIATYGDLLRTEEVFVGCALVAILAIVGLQVRILSITAFGHQRELIFGSRKKIGQVFAAIRRASTDRYASQAIDPRQI